MRVFRPTYRDKGSGERREGSRWWIEVKDHRGLSRRFPAFPEKAASLALGRRIESLVVCRMNHEQPGRELSRWLERASGKLLDRLTRFDLLDGTRSAAGKRLSEHLADFRQSLLSKGDTPGQACQVARRAEKVFAACGFTTWTDLRADRVERCLADLRSGPKGLSAQTSNGYLQAVKQFARWMIENRRALESPVAHLKALNVRTDRRHDRTYLEVEEMRRLLQATRRGPVRFGMDGNERAMLYQVAAETGLRRGELASLKVSSFDLDRQTVTVVASYSKRRREDVVPLRPETAEALKAFFAGKTPHAKAFGGTYKRLTPKTADMLRLDLADAGISYTDDAGRFRDFYCLRHTCGSWLAANDVHPKVAQAIMRHSDINLTMSRYTHTLRGQEAEAVAKLPDLSTPAEAEAQRATGTDGRDVTMSSDLAPRLARTRPIVCNEQQRSAGANPTGDIENADSTTPGAIRTHDLRFRKPVLYPTELRAHLEETTILLLRGRVNAPTPSLQVKHLSGTSLRAVSCLRHSVLLSGVHSDGVVRYLSPRRGDRQPLDVSLLPDSALISPETAV